MRIHRITLGVLMIAALAFPTFAGEKHVHKSRGAGLTLDPNNLGKGMWILDLWECNARFTGNPKGPNLDTLCQYIKNSLKLDWVAIKAGESCRFMPEQFNPEVIAVFHSYDIKVFGYVKAFGGPNINCEATVAQQTIATAGMDGLLIVTAQTYDNNPQADAWAEAYLSQFAKPNDPSRNYVLGYAPYAIKTDHIYYPYNRFDSYCDVAMPLSFWIAYFQKPSAKEQVTSMVRVLAKDWGKSKIALAPVGQVLPVTQKDPRRVLVPQELPFTNLVKKLRASDGSQKIHGISFWILDDLINPGDAAQIAASNINSSTTSRKTKVKEKTQP